MPIKNLTKLELAKRLVNILQMVTIPKNYFYNYPRVDLTLNYAMVRFVDSKHGFKVEERQPNVMFNAIHITDKKEISIHLRASMKDKRENLSDTVDIDIYFPEDMIEKLLQLKETTEKNENL